MNTDSHIFQIEMRERFHSSFLGDGDAALRFRQEVVEPHLEHGNNIVIFDFSGIENMNDSFANACFVRLFSAHRDLLGSRLRFKACSSLVRHFIESALALAQKNRH